jgi:3-oxoacyl-[acyl-carrier-protein] synthase II
MLTITGAGLITSVGAGKDACFAAFCDGVSGNRPLQQFEAAKFMAQRAFEIVDNRLHGGSRRATTWLCAAIDEALRMSELPIAGKPIAIVVGTGLRELRSVERWHTAGEPLDLAELHFDTAVRAATKTTGPIFTLCNACAASLSALGLAADLLESGDAEAAIVAGCDSITESMLGLVDRATLTPPERVEPFDRKRRGLLMGEGAAAIVLETSIHARARHAPPCASLLAVGISCDAHHETAPDRDGVARAMVDAHTRAGIIAADVDVLFVHGTGTALNDRIEALAITDVFGPSVSRVPMTALKSLTGHTSGASGLVGLVTAIESLRHGRVPPTLGLDDPAEEAQQFDIVRGAARQADLRVAQVNAFGFGGVNAVALIGKS